MMKPPAALLVACDVCMAPAGEKCNQPTDNGRKPMPERWYHYSRELAGRAVRDGAARD